MKELFLFFVSILISILTKSKKNNASKQQRNIPVDMNAENNLTKKVEREYKKSNMREIKINDDSKIKKENKFDNVADKDSNVKKSFDLKQAVIYSAIYNRPY